MQSMHADGDLACACSQWAAGCPKIFLGRGCERGLRSRTAGRPFANEETISNASPPIKCLKAIVESSAGRLGHTATTPADRDLAAKVPMQAYVLPCLTIALHQRPSLEITRFLPCPSRLPQQDQCHQRRQGHGHGAARSRLLGSMSPTKSVKITLDLCNSGVQPVPEARSHPLDKAPTGSS